MNTHTKEIAIGNVKIGAGNPIAVQSMTNTDTCDIEATATQINQLAGAGCEIIRSAVYDLNSAKAIKYIKDKISIPLVADVHFDYKLAIAAIESGADKIRINPGNIGKKERIQKIVDCAKSHHIPIRIGVNSGSIEKEIQQELGNTADAMAKSAMKHVEMLENRNFYNMVVSLKGSDVVKTINACKAFDKMSEYPQHIGITEAGTMQQGLAKSGVGIGTLLNQKIGDTIRVSLSCDPIIEVQAAWDILSACGLRKRGIEIVSCPTCARTTINVEDLAVKVKNEFKDVIKHIKIAVMGCVVNGPGEAREADLGIAGGKEHSIIFYNGEIVEKVENDNAMDALRQQVKKYLNK
ncbi:MAG: flavodoxin-dependent (E)-4-hydroxy-3-methylbut-2-enyl-diphosphate synthase [Clostridiales bacterium]|nr:flavodoxin-dependent (E)-4-hydroxy-3-methylbut-2-enyl-diphosphate synthase [Clostridiales bacterium]